MSTSDTTEITETLGAVLDRLAGIIAARKGADPKTSYTASLFAGGPGYCAKKFAEESVETVVAAANLQKGGDKDALVHEAGDVLFHLLALLASCDVSPVAVAAELARREGQSGHAEKAARTD